MENWRLLNDKDVVLAAKPSNGTSHKPHKYLDLFCRQVFGATEHVALGASVTAEFMNLHHLAERDQSNESVRWQQAEGHL